jgi:hypothetical protein
MLKHPLPTMGHTTDWRAGSPLVVVKTVVVADAAASG